MAEKRETWMQRSGNRVTGLNIRELSLTGVSQLPKWYTASLESVKTFNLTLKGPDVMVRLKKTHGWRFDSLEQLTIHGGYVSSGRNTGLHQLPDELHCGVAGSTNLKSLKVSHMAFSGPKYETPHRLSDPAFGNYVTAYPNLQRLVIDYCPIPNTYNRAFCSESENGTKYRVDPLHKMLRGAGNLEYLDAMPYTETLDDRRPTPGMGKRVTVSKLKYARIPPPMLWCIDISAPSLETLVFAIPIGPAFETAEVELLPRLIHAPVPDDAFSSLTFVELVLGELDTVSRLDELAFPVDNVTTLVLRNTAPYPGRMPVSEMQSTPSSKAYMAVTQLLADRPHLCPQLKDLCLYACISNGKTLVDFVRARKRSGSVTIRRLHGTLFTALSNKTKATLNAEVSYCRLQALFPSDGEYYQNDYFDSEISQAQV